MPNEYLYFYFYRDRAVSSILKSGKTRGETILEINQDMQKKLMQMDIDKDFDTAFHCFMEHYVMRENNYFSIESGEMRKDQISVPTLEEFLNAPENGSYASVALDFMKARQGGKPVHMVLSVPNGGAVPFLHPEDVCELSCTVTKEEVLPDAAPPVPKSLQNLILTVKSYENLTVEAILEKSRSKAIEALLLHPLVFSYPLAEKLVDAYLAAYHAYTGDWT